MRTLVFFFFVGLIVAPTFSFADIEAPIKLAATDLTDLGDFHGQKAAENPLGWGFWGAREPIVTPDWIVFPVKGKYTFIIESQSHQFDKENDTKNGVFAEVDLRGRFSGLNGVKKIAKSVGEQKKGELLILHTRIRADSDKDEWFTEELEAGTVDPKNKVAIKDDKETGIIEFEQQMKAQLAIWFTNDEWDPDQVPAWDRNLRLKSLEILLPFGARSVDSKSKLATTWSSIKSVR